MLDLYRKSTSIQNFEEVLASQDELLLENLWDSPKALLLLLARERTQKNILVLQANTGSEKVSSNFSYFGEENLLEFPAWETLPGEEIAPSSDIVGRRFETLAKLQKKESPTILFCSLQALLQKVLSPQRLDELCAFWKVGDTISFSSIPEKLQKLGYVRNALANEKGTFAVRGGIIDIFPLSAPSPYRIDFFGDTIDQIKTYDPISQKSISKIDKFFLCPGSEYELLQKENELSLLLDYFPEDTILVFDDLIELEDKYVALKGMPGSKSRLFCSFEEFYKKTKKCKKIYFASDTIENLSPTGETKKPGRSFYSGKTPSHPVSFSIFDQKITAQKIRHSFHEIADFFSPFENTSAGTQDEILHGIHRLSHLPITLQFVSANEAEKTMLMNIIAKQEISCPQDTSFTLGYLSKGFVLEDLNLAILPYTEFTHRYKIKRQKWRSTYHVPPSDFHELSPGDLVVHFQHGIGKYLGIEKTTNHTGQVTEFLVIEYAENSKFYTPISQSHLVSRYIGVKEEVPTLHTLGTNKWQKTKLQTQQAIIGYAEELLHMQARREIKGGFTFKEDSHDMLLFEEEFPYVETEDQKKAIDEIKLDMISAKAMDRLLCGDVGYGKTEVAMRAAFKAVVDGHKQVAVLVPTTVLAMQHYETFTERMSNFPLKIACLSRFTKAQEVRRILADLKEGHIDILVGTHRILSEDILFKDLGLMIVDEEQRFGVKAKEHLKKRKEEVECLTLSATPIPRTLYLSLVGARDVSIIHTPPQDRLPITTIITERDSQTIQNALMRELSRDGQAYFIHNRVESIFMVSEEIQKLLPEARIITGHGQMSPEELDAVFHAFKSGKADILVATTIVENGIDIPNANTILIDNSERFGLADLYQLRGRVGRWNRPAYSYFLTPKHRALPENQRKKLYALKEASGYGGGMKIAMRDLEIRGAGDILGIKQSGQISSIGFHLYCKLLKKAVLALQKKSVTIFTETKMEFSHDARLPEEYIGETTLRWEMYHRLGDSESLEEVDAIFAELKDRFGTPPEPTVWLYHLTKIKVFASQHGFTLLKFENYTFTAERQKKKEVIKKVIPLPKTKKPDLFEKEILSLLKAQFAL
ncbi:MAG: transcription-repair coupling factor [Chlamydiae bacterium]|nr:transcription-repair coupling factor [Chlamydiota bacterium]